ncbi:MAG: hypothetical protein GF401_20745 [Chitinivibrionales bacterium]|nr:hypothetical protein [Chitinivibrionales bacterium]
MPSHYTWDPSQRILRASFFGVVNNEDLRKLALDVARDPVIVPPIYELIDLRSVEEVSADSEGMRFVANVELTYREKFQGQRISIIAPTNLLYGMARMYEMISSASDTPSEISVFKTAEEAEAWLVGTNEE